MKTGEFYVKDTSNETDILRRFGLFYVDKEASQTHGHLVDGKETLMLTSTSEGALKVMADKFNASIGQTINVSNNA